MSATPRLALVVTAAEDERCACGHAPAQHRHHLAATMTVSLVTVDHSCREPWCRCDRFLARAFVHPERP